MTAHSPSAAAVLRAMSCPCRNSSPSRQAPRQPALRPAGRELERRDEREGIARGFLRPQQHRRRVARLRGGDGGISGVELLLRDGAESNPARFHAAIIS
jgi:hypothetical protein